MKRMTLLTLSFAVVGFAATGGCNSAASNSENSPGEVKGHDHDHDGHHDDHEGHEEHEHDADEHAHSHGAAGPHGGHLIELGDASYHAELVLSDDMNQIILFLLDGRAARRAAARVDEATLNLIVEGMPVQYELAAFPHEDETPDRCSRFAATDARLVGCFRDDQQLRGRLNLIIAGKPYVGAVEHPADAQEPAKGHHDHQTRPAQQPLTRR